MTVDASLLPPRYRSPERIGSGGMGDIFLATDEVLGRPVVVKLLSVRYARDNAIRRRFTREALAAARLTGEEGAVTIYDVGDWQDRPFIVMEYVRGGSLEERLRSHGAHPPAQALEWLEQAAQAIDAAHRHGVVHRDVKPANLLLDERERVRVADFGIASAAGLDSLTLTGTILGTTGYLSPEQARGERATSASDRYALAVVAYELLSGVRPFANESVTAEAAGHVNAPVPSLSERHENLPPELDAVFQRALAKDPAARYDSAADFVADMRDALSRAPGTTRDLGPVPVVRPAPARPRRLLPVLVVLAAAGVGAIVAVLLTRGGGHSATRVVTVRVTGPAGKVTTVTVARQQTVTAPAPPPPPPAISGSSGHALNDQGYQLIQQGNYGKAIPLLQQAVQMLGGTGPADPYEAYANYNLGYAFYRSGRCSEAVPYLQRAEELEPQRHEPRQLLKRAARCS
jgi:tRNA A-37 threonylcarbamoyl transferase component Bud32